MKLELKHLAPYLPYGLKIKNAYGVHIMDSFVGSQNINYTINNVESKPILRPLSDLNKKKFKDIVFPVNHYSGERIEYDRNISVSMVQIQSLTNQSVTFYGTVEKLFELHFDVFGLIEKGLAIDINTI